MQPMKQLEKVLESLADREHYLFTGSDFEAALPGRGGLAVLLCRAQKAGVLKRVCRGVYLYPRVNYPRGMVLFHAAARLRASGFNYISLETALSDAGVISQVPINWITLMSSGRSQVVDCADFGRIEFVHTTQLPGELAEDLTYDLERRLWRASTRQALRDMRATRRTQDLVNPEVAHELV
jgi:predicted transcriptional regulator of viral defense system